jgi:3-hydroxyisobutyrate dehydrogenase
MMMHGLKTVVGFVGIGVMGKSMASNLMAAGYQMHISSRTREKAEELIGRGAVWHDTAGEVAAVADVVITIVGYPRDVEEVYLGAGGILQNGRKNSIVIDMTTSSPELAARIYAEAGQRGIHSLDAPVSGGDIGARDARLSIMVGGDREVFEAALPLFQVMGQNVVYHGSAGSGQHCKMANQIAIASNIMGVCEAIRYAEKAGLRPETVLKSIETGAAASWSLSNLAPRMITGDFKPGFYIKHFIKDMGIALESCQKIGLDAAGLALAKSIYDELAAKGEENSGTQALYKHYK